MKVTNGTITIGVGLLFGVVDALLRDRQLEPLDDAGRLAFLEQLQAESETATAAEREALRAEITAYRERLAARQGD